MPDSEQENNSFAIKLELMPTTYIFCCPTSDPPVYQTVCKHLADYLNTINPIFTMLAWNTFATCDLDGFQKLPKLITEYWESTGNQCIPYS